MGRGKGRAAPKKTYKQTPIRNILPTLHRPASAIGRQIKVPGSYWACPGVVCILTLVERGGRRLS
jgi:hypothetical protein